MTAIDDAVASFQAGSKSLSTRYAYERDWQQLREWMDGRAFVVADMTPELLSAYLAYQVVELGRNPASVARSLAGIRYHLSKYGVHDLTSSQHVRDTLAGIRRRIQHVPKEAPPLVLELTRKCVDKIMDGIGTGTARNDLLCLRDRALFLLGFYSDLRTASLSNLDFGNLEWTDEANMIVHVKRSKTDQEGKGRMVPIWRMTDSPYCPVQAVTAYASALDLRQASPLFQSFKCLGARLSRESISRVITERTAEAGLKGYSGHSLRAGYITTCARNGVSAHEIARISGHKSMSSLNKYIRRSELFEFNPLGEVS